MTRILFIEDQLESIQPVLDLCWNQLEDFEHQISDFEDAQRNVQQFRPDIVVLDILRGSPAENDAVGLSSYDFIWNHQFCPIVVYSARTDLFSDDEWPPHPFVTEVRKGVGSPEEILKAILEFLPHVSALQKIENSVRECLSIAMREVAPHAFRTFTDAAKREELIMRSGRRRVAAMMDVPPINESALASWECYLYPPVLPDTQLGDVLKLVSGDSNDPSSFRVVLTPSCDMVQSNGQQPKVQQILAAKCCSMEEALPLVGLRGNKNAATIKDRILSSGYAQTIVPFPRLEEVIPLMAANLRDLELTPIAAIGEGQRFIRIASIDSPFRELIAWAYMQIACRPGLPDRNLDSWAKEIVNTG